LYSRLGGNVLGWLDLDDLECLTDMEGNYDFAQKLDFLQEHASKLVPHPTRTFREVLLYVDDKLVVPEGYAYNDEVCIVDVCVSSRVEMLWNENDNFAKTFVDTWYEKYNAGIPKPWLHYETVHIYMTRGLSIPRALLWYENVGITSWTCYTLGGDDASQDASIQVDLGFLQRARSVERLSVCKCIPRNWQHCNVRHVRLDLPGILDARVLLGLDRLEVLTLCWQATHVKALEGLPRLRRLTLGKNNTNKVCDTFEGQELTNFFHS